MTLIIWTLTAVLIALLFARAKDKIYKLNKKTTPTVKAREVWWFYSEATIGGLLAIIASILITL